METWDILSAATRINNTSLHALGNGAVVTLPFHLSASELASFAYRPGDEIELETENENHPRLRCRILDLETVKKGEDPQFSIRITLEKA